MPPSPDPKNIYSEIGTGKMSPAVAGHRELVYVPHVQSNDIYVIDPKLCTECVGFHDHEACQAVCPVECCLPDPNKREEEGLLLERALRLHPDDAELKARASRNDFPSRFRIKE